VQKYANGNFKEWEEKVKARPENEKTGEALAQFLENCKLKNCIKSNLYHKILNLE
jgi:hypothetical protein